MTSRLLPIALVAMICSAARPADPDPRLAGYRVAPGFKVTIAATEPLVINPVAMTFGDDGRLFVIEWNSGNGPNDHIKVLTDTDGDGVFDKSAIYMDGLELPAGLLFWDGWTYITLGQEVVRFKDKDGDGKLETREVIASGFGNDNSHHRVSGLTMGPDGWIYITTGDSDAHARGSDGSTATVLRSGGVFRCKPDGSHMENVAFGMRNPFGNVAFDDEFHIFHTDNDNEGSVGFTGCRILHVVEGGDYGWRLREGARCCQPDYERATWNGGRPGRLGHVAETGRGAPAGLCVLNSAAFPPSTRNLLVYPDVFRKTVRAYKLKPAGATYTVAEEFELLGSDDGLFRPDDAEIGTDGALYVLDWRTDSGGAGQLSGNGKFGRIYRLTWAGTSKEPKLSTFPRDRFAILSASTEDDLIQSLESRDFGSRQRASFELIRRTRDPKIAAAVNRKLRPLRIEDGHDLLPRLHALDIVASLPRPQEQITYARPWIVAPSNQFVLQRRAFELASRFADSNDAIGLFMWLPMRIDNPQTERARALFLGRFGTISRDKDLGGVDKPLSATELIEIGRKNLNEPLPDLRTLRDLEPAKREEAKVSFMQRSERMSMLRRHTTADLIARVLIEYASNNALGDSFLRDGYARGLERLGKPSIEELVKAIKSGEAKKSGAALYALQGWRTTEGLDALMAEATGSDPIPAEARAGLFKALRELGPAVPPEPIVEWLEKEPKADALPRAEAIRVLAAMRDRAMFPAAKVLPTLLADPDGSVRRAALGLATVARAEAIKAVLIEVVKADGRPADEKGLALVALRGYEGKELIPLFLSAIDTTRDGTLKGDLLRSIAASDFAAAARKAEGYLGDRDQNLRSAAIAVLGQKADTALLVATRYNEGKLPPEDLPRVLEAIRSHATPELQAATQLMLKSKLLAAPTGAEARRLRDYVTRQGNPSRGKAVFLDARKGGCASCHRLEGVGVAVGPDLTKMYETLTFDKRVESILEPSKEIKEGYNTFTVATTDGRSLSGLLIADTPEGVTLKDAQGKEIKIPAREIEQKAPDKVSLMPVGVVGHLSFAELADLLAFLGDRKAQESLRAEGK
jgi:putative membrane-bound dehydrogenase-like protein